MACWMNEAEIDHACTLLSARAPELAPYAMLLSDWRDTVNSNSDGWPYWSGGTRPAARLMELVERAAHAIQGFRQVTMPTAEEMSRTLGPIKAAATRHKLPFPELRPAAEPDAGFGPR